MFAHNTNMNIHFIITNSTGRCYLKDIMKNVSLYVTRLEVDGKSMHLDTNFSRLSGQNFDPNATITVSWKGKTSHYSFFVKQSID